MSLEGLRRIVADGHYYVHVAGARNASLFALSIGTTEEKYTYLLRGPEWELDCELHLPFLPHGRRCALSPDGRMIASATYNRLVVAEIDRKKPAKLIDTREFKEIDGVRFSDDGSELHVMFSQSRIAAVSTVDWRQVFSVSDALKSIRVKDKNMRISIGKKSLLRLQATTGEILMTTEFPYYPVDMIVAYPYIAVSQMGGPLHLYIIEDAGIMPYWRYVLDQGRHFVWLEANEKNMIFALLYAFDTKDLSYLVCFDVKERLIQWKLTLQRTAGCAFARGGKYVLTDCLELVDTETFEQKFLRPWG